MNILVKILGLPRFFRIRLYPYINRMVLRSKGVIYGANCTIPGKLNMVFRGGSITIGDNFYFSSGEAINPISSNLQGSIYLDSPEARLIIGDNVGMSGTRMWIHQCVTIGSNVKIGAGVLIMDTDCHEEDYRVRNGSMPSSSCDGQSVKSAPVSIEDDVWIGAHSIILKGVTIGARSIIGAGSVVTMDVPADSIAVGSPCRVVRKLNGTS